MGYQDGRGPQRLRPVPGRCERDPTRRPRRGVLAGVDHHAVDAPVERGPGRGRRRPPTAGRARRRAADRGAPPLRERVLGDEGAVARRSRARRSSGVRYEPPVPERRGRARGGGRRLRLDGGRHRASCTSPPRSARRTSRSAARRGWPVFKPVDDEGHVHRPGAGVRPRAVRQGRRPDDHRGPARARRAVPRRRRSSTRTRSAGAASTPLLYYARTVLVRPHHGGEGAAARRERRGQLGTPSTSSTAGTATGWRTTSTGRSPASGTGARRCRSGGAARAPDARSARWRSWASAPAATCADIDPHRPAIDDVTFACPECGGTATRVPEVIDAWYDSGAMPFAQWGYHPELGRGEAVFAERVPGRLHLRGDRPDARLVLHADGRGRAALRLDRRTATWCASDI